jgi:hypothetical protein
VPVIKACLYEPQVNRSYAEMAAHYDTAIPKGGAARYALAVHLRGLDRAVSGAEAFCFGIAT